MSALPIHQIHAVAKPTEPAAETAAVPVSVEIAETFVVHSAAARAEAAGHMQRFKQMEDAAHERLDPICDKTYAAWKESTKQRGEVVGPLEQARKLLGAKVAAFDLAEKQRVEREQREAMLAEQERAAALREESIEYLEQIGASPLEIGSLCAAPLTIAPVVIPQPQSKSGVSSRFVFKGRVTNLAAFLLHATQPGNEHLAAMVEVDEGKLNKFVGAVEGKIKLPGIEVYQDAVSCTRKGGK